MEKAAEYWNPGKVNFWTDAGTPMVIDRRDGYFLYDMSGKRLIDLHLNGGTYNFGHRHPELVEVLKSGLDYFDMGNHWFPSVARAAFAEQLVKTAPHTKYAIFGAGGALATGEPENFAVVGGTVLAGLSFGQATTKALIRASNAKKGKDFIRSKTKEDEWTGFINELKETGVDLDKINIKKNFKYYKDSVDDARTLSKDFADLGQTKGLLDKKTTLMTRYILDDMEILFDKIPLEKEYAAWEPES